MTTEGSALAPADARWLLDAAIQQYRVRVAQHGH